eukprot:CAMPEP_0181224448 /NCGR_PEP_ID=MMETSP1096-20121128/31133_1 /TAXON_ID=156174 ORGANISM="Chrysochromulina ericina, Strain CCMP281" /NCGR_SAMPLE_ID=MMETSP1096 /ASSEMBLY_ACC=CAM_ASM_000453 /LENGTH=102 /DNA_ID=CAMNT_0023317533 /DNA_START=244 /DNA_END=552 /DNA_ORIENTATION=-
MPCPHGAPPAWPPALVSDRGDTARSSARGRLQTALERRAGFMASLVSPYLHQRWAARLQFCCAHHLAPGTVAARAEAVLTKLRAEQQRANAIRDLDLNEDST